jgi:hypothetical protein
MPEIIVRPRENGSMKIDLDSEEIARIVKALEHYHAYLRSQQRDDSRHPWHFWQSASGSLPGKLRPTAIALP